MQVECRYQGDAVANLLRSYQGDENPYLIDPSIKFPERDHELVEIRGLKQILFPNYWNAGALTQPDNQMLLAQKLNALGDAFCLGIQPHISDASEINRAVKEVLDRLPEIREVLKKDVVAAYRGDPSARTYTEIIRSFPGFFAIMIHRVAHVLYECEVPSYPRELSEYVHSVTGVDIHPGANIGEHFFIDHGSGVVIGETSEVGDHVRIYQSVTLGALHFEKDEDGALRKDYKRHPTIGNHVVIGMGAKILGPVSIGNHVSIGANSWIQEDIPGYTDVFITEHPRQIRKQKRNAEGV